MIGTAVAIVVAGAILTLVGTAIGLWQTQRIRVGAGVPASVLNLGVVVLVVGIVAVIFGAGYVLYEVIAP